jgi:hypothetical protein
MRHNVTQQCIPARCWNCPRQMERARGLVSPGEAAQLTGTSISRHAPQRMNHQTIFTQRFYCSVSLAHLGSLHRSWSQKSCAYITGEIVGHNAINAVADGCERKRRRGSDRSYRLAWRCNVMSTQQQSAGQYQLSRSGILAKGSGVSD